MTRKDVIREMEARGYQAVEREIIKNGVTFEAISVQVEKTVSVLLYPSERIERAERAHRSVKSLVDELLDEVKEAQNKKPSLPQMPDLEFIKTHVYVAMQKESEEEIERKSSSYDGIEEYLYMRSGKYRAKITRKIMETLPCKREELWKWGMENTIAEAKIESMQELFLRLLGISVPEEHLDKPFYIISNVDGCMGASAILAKNKLKELADQLHVSQLVILPSSIHEMVVIPYTDDVTLEMCSELVKGVMMEQVLPEDRLTDRAYIITV